MHHPFDQDRLAIEVQALTSAARTLQAEHQAQLAPYRTACGDVSEDHLREYDDARISTAIEASDYLDTLLNQLTLLTGPPVRTPFTVTIASRERHDGERPYSFALYATGLEDALRILPQLPTFQGWLREAAELASEGAEPDVTLVPEQCHPGLRAPGEYIDLRAEQARTPTPSHTAASLPTALSVAHRSAARRR
ncbi:hypothetical protein [Streptomyces sp. NPDC048340]|uniref:hypothetical protein n=1 Tax=Streptomyces sp. NPDC048340 TaxID=3365537 RepID=UPI00371E17E2